MSLQYSKWFNDATPKDEKATTGHEFNHIDIVEDTIFESLKQGDITLVPGILSGVSCKNIGHSKERFHDIKVLSGTIHAFSLVELGE